MDELYAFTCEILKSGQRYYNLAMIMNVSIFLKY